MKNQLRVISASRRVDMAGFFADKLRRTLLSRCPPDQAHTVVIWTKVPSSLRPHTALCDVLSRYHQVYVHATVTGMGGSFLEPGVPDPAAALAALPALVEMTGNPERVRIRFDPVVRIRLPGGAVYTNRPWFGRVAKTCRECGIPAVTVSWFQVYEKSSARMQKFGLRPVPFSTEETVREASFLREEAAALGMNVEFCCVPGLPTARCIDGPLFSRLHPRGLEAPPEKAGGQRLLCGCTKSWDIGWYYTCPGGCVYCYGRPALRPDRMSLPGPAGPDDGVFT